MSQTISQVMTPDPWTVQESAPIQDAARIMRDADIGDVIVLRPDESVCGIVTDRDLVVRALADGSDPKTTTVADVCRHSVVSISSGDPVDQAVPLMREHNISGRQSRPPCKVAHGGRPVTREVTPRQFS